MSSEKMDVDPLDESHNITMEELLGELNELLTDDGDVGSIKRHFMESPTTLSDRDFLGRLQRVRKKVREIVKGMEGIQIQKCATQGMFYWKDSFEELIKFCQTMINIFKEIQDKLPHEIKELSAFFSQSLQVLFTTIISISANAFSSTFGTQLRKSLIPIEALIMWSFFQSTADNSHSTKLKGMCVQLLKSRHSRNLGDLIGIILAIPGLQEALRPVFRHFLGSERSSSDPLASSVLKALKLIRGQAGSMEDSELKRCESRIRILVQLTIRQPRKQFLKNVIPFVSKISKAIHGNKEMEKSFYKVYLFLRVSGVSVPNKVVSHQAETLMLILTPNLPSGLERENFDAEFFGQFRLMICSLTSMDDDVRIVAIEKLQIWLMNYWESLVTYQLKNVVEALQTLGKLMLHHQDSPKTAEAAINALTEIMLQCTEAHDVINDIFSGDENFENRQKHSINISRLILSKNLKVRLAFVKFLRASNKTLRVRWNHICETKRLYRKLLEDSNPEVKSNIALLLRYQFFTVKDENDKQGVIETLQKLTKLYQESSELCMAMIVEIASCWEDCGFTKMVFLQLMRKLGHLVKHQLHEAHNETEGDLQQLSSAMMVGAALWRSSYCTKILREASKDIKAREVESVEKSLDGFLKVVTEVDATWKKVTENAFALDHNNQDLKVAILFLAGIWKHDDIDRICVPLKSQIKRGTVHPALLVQIFVKWNRVADIWSVISAWFEKQLQDDGPGRLRFSIEENEDSLNIDHICKYVDALSTYPESFKHKAAVHVYNGLIAFQRQYYDQLKNKRKLSEIYETTTPVQFAILIKLKFQLNMALGSLKEADFNNTEDFQELEEVLSSEEVRYGAEPTLNSILISTMQNIAERLQAPIDIIPPGSVIEDQIEKIFTQNPNIPKTYCHKVRTFVETLIRFKIYKAKGKGTDFNGICRLLRIIFGVAVADVDNKIVEKELKSLLHFVTNVKLENFQNSLRPTLIHILEEDNPMYLSVRDHLLSLTSDELGQAFELWSVINEEDVIELVGNELLTQLKFKNTRLSETSNSRYRLYQLLGEDQDRSRFNESGFDNDDPIHTTMGTVKF